MRNNSIYRISFYPPYIYITFYSFNQNQINSDEAKIKQILESRHKIQGDMSIRGSSFSTHARK